MTRWTTCTRRWRNSTRSSECFGSRLRGTGMKFRTMIIAAAALVIAAAGFAQLSMAKADWARGPVQFLMTTDELSQWKAVKSDTEADQFIALFWARRDPTPGTPRNEFREDFETRVQYADQHF